MAGGWRYRIRSWQRKKGIPWRIFRTSRCLVREITLEDLPALYTLYDGPGMTDYMEPLYPWEEELEYTKNYIEMIYGFYGYGMWVVIEKKTGRLIGRVGFDDRMVPTVGNNGDHRILELGYMIASDMQRQGYAAEVCAAAIDYAFCELEEEVVTCLIETGNEASRRLVKKLGFSCAGVLSLKEKQMEEWNLKRKSAQKK